MTKADFGTAWGVRRLRGRRGEAGVHWPRGPETRGVGAAVAELLDFLLCLRCAPIRSSMSARL